MAVTTQNSKDVKAGDGVSTVFYYTFSLPAGSTGSEIKVYVFDTSGNMTDVTAQSTVNVAAASVTYPNAPGIAPLQPSDTALPENWTLVIARVEPITQGTSLTTQGPFPASVIMGMIDYLTMICQQLQEQINRATLVAINTPGPAVPVTPPSVLTAGALLINGTWNAIAAYATSNPTTQFFAYVNSGDLVGQYFFYTGDITKGNNGFETLAGG